MAIAFDVVSTGTGASPSWSHTCTGSNVLLFVAAYSVTADTVTGITFDGVAMTFVNKIQTSPGNNEWAYLYVIVVGTGSGTAKTIAVTGGDGAWGLSYTGCNQSTTLDSNNTLGNVSTDPLVVSTTVVASNCWLVGSYAGNRATLAGAGTTLRGGTGQFNCCDSNGTVGTGSQSLSVDQNGSSAAVNAMGIASFAPAPPAPTHKFFQLVEKA